MPPELIQAFDVCYNDDQVCRMVNLSNYYSLAPDGVTGVVQHINKATKDFRGDRILIVPNIPHHQVWSKWKSIMALPRRNWKPSGQARVGAVIETLLGSIADPYNFTFDTNEPPPRTKFHYCGSGMIQMGSVPMCFLAVCPYFLSTMEFTADLRVLTISKLLAHSPFALESLFMPFERLVAATLGCLSLGLALALALSLRSRDSSGVVLLTFFPTVLSSPSHG